MIYRSKHGKPNMSQGLKIQKISSREIDMNPVYWYKTNSDKQTGLLSDSEELLFELSRKLL